MNTAGILIASLGTIIITAILGLCISRRSAESPKSEERLPAALPATHDTRTGQRTGDGAEDAQGLGPNDVVVDVANSARQAVSESGAGTGRKPPLAATEASLGASQTQTQPPVQTQAGERDGRTGPPRPSSPGANARAKAPLEVSGGASPAGRTLREQYGDSAAWNAYADHIAQMSLPPPQSAPTGSLLSAYRKATSTNPEEAAAAEPEVVLGPRPVTPAEALARLKANPGSTHSSLEPPSSRGRLLRDQASKPRVEVPIPTSVMCAERSLKAVAAQQASPTPVSASSPAKLASPAVSDAGLGASTLSNGKPVTLQSAARNIVPPVEVKSGKVAGPDVRTDINLDELHVGEEIGRGGFGRVYSGVYQGKPVAVKMLLGANNSRTELEALKLEISILSHASHPHVMKIYGGNLSPPQPFIVAELLMCSLHDYIYHPQADTRTLLVVRLARGIAGALSYLHPAVLHRDLKPGNVLLSQEGEPKIADFGLARWKLKTLLSTQTLEAGSVPYLAPECFDPDNWHLTDRVDIYSLGVIISEMLMRTPPWHGMSSMQVAWEVHMQGRRPALPPPSPHCPQALLDLVRACWAQDPRARPAAAQVHQTLCDIHDQLDG